MRRAFTVVLLREISMHDGSPLDAHTVEVLAKNPTKAIREALDEVDDEHGDVCRPLAVFEGHHQNEIVNTEYAR